MIALSAPTTAMTPDANSSDLRSADMPRQTAADGVPRRDLLSSLTGLRFLAALYVVAFHQRLGLHMQPAVLQNIIDHGYVAVPLFFVLSGFVLAYTYVDGAGVFRGSSRAFYVARLARIYPVYVLAFTLCIPIILRAPHAIPAGKVPATAWSTLMLTQAWTGLIFWNKPGWSLSTEGFFYLAFPLLVPLLGRWRGRVLLVAIGTLWLFDLLPIIAYWALGPSDTWLEVVKHNPVLRLPEFLIGVAVGMVFLERHASDRPDVPALIWTDTGCVLTAVVGIGIAVSLRTGHIGDLFLHNGVLAPLFALLVYGLARGRGMVARMLALRPMILLGEASYGVYILQAPIADLCKAAIAFLITGRIGVDLPILACPAFVVGYTILLVGCAVLSLRWLEEPCRKAIRSWSARTLTRPSPAPSPRRPTPND